MMLLWSIPLINAAIYHPVDSDTPVPCPRDPIYYCPPGAVAPLVVKPGFYSMDNNGGVGECPPGFYCENGLKRQNN